MITSITPINVRLFEGSEWRVPLSPLTLFCGTNSAGKSTLLKLPLLLKQSQLARGKRGRLSLTGPLVDFGSYYSIISGNDTTRVLGLSLTAPVEFSSRQLRPLGVHLPRPRGTAKKHECTISAHFSFSGESDPALGLAGDQQGPETPPRRALLDKASFALSLGDNQLLTWELHYAGKREDHSPQYEIAVPRAYVETVSGGWLRPKDSTQEAWRFVSLMHGILPSALWASVKRSPKDQVTSRTSVPLPPIIDECTMRLETTLGRVHYLGPIRAAPERYYISEERDFESDASGESLPLLLGESLHLQVLAPMLPAAPAERVPLFDALNYWYHYLRTGEFASEVPEGVTLPRTMDVVEFRLAGNGRTSHALADSGFGYSQVLPILVRGLLAKRGDTVIVEQPELHLNPALQVRLVDFFVGLVRAGKQVLIETHSEHIVNAVRVAIAEDETRQLFTSAKILYVGLSDGAPVLTPLSISENGAVPEWPAEFLGEAAHLAGRLFRAQRRFMKS